MYDKDGETLGTGDGEIHILDFDQDSDLARSEVGPVAIHRNTCSSARL